MDIEVFDIIYCRTCLVSASDEWKDINEYIINPEVNNNPENYTTNCTRARFTDIIQLIHSDTVSKHFL